MGNQVIYGDYEGCPVVMHKNMYCIETSEFYVALSPDNISSWEVSTEKKLHQQFLWLVEVYLEV